MPDKPGYHAVLQNRKLRDGDLNAYWVQVNNNLQAAANLNEEGLPGYRNPENFIVVSDAYPTVTAQAADLILPTSMWVEKEGAYGNAERRTQFWHELVPAPGDAHAINMIIGNPVRRGSTLHAEGLIDNIAHAGADGKSNDRKDHQRNENFNQSET